MAVPFIAGAWAVAKSAAAWAGRRQAWRVATRAGKSIWEAGRNLATRTGSQQAANVTRSARNARHIPGAAGRGSVSRSAPVRSRVRIRGERLGDFPHADRAFQNAFRGRMHIPRRHPASPGPRGSPVQHRPLGEASNIQAPFAGTFRGGMAMQGGPSLQGAQTALAAYRRAHPIKNVLWNGLVFSAGAGALQLSRGALEDVVRERAPEGEPDEAMALWDAAIEAGARGDADAFEGLMGQFVEETGIQPHEIDGVLQTATRQAMDRRHQERQDSVDAVTSAVQGGIGPTQQQQIDALVADVPGANMAGMSPDVFAAQNEMHQRMGAENRAIAAMHEHIPSDIVFTGMHSTQPHDPFMESPEGTMPFFGGIARSEPDFAHVSNVRGEIFGMSQEELVDVQHKLFATGMYPPSMSYEDIDFGTRDPMTLAAFERLLDHAGAYTAWAIQQGGGFLTWDQLLEGMIDDMGGMEDALSAAQQADEPTYVVTLTHPDTVRNALRTIGRRTIGRGGMAPEDERHMVAFIHQQQRQQQLSQQRAHVHGEPGQVVETASIDVGASLEEELRRRFPNEAGAEDMGRTYDDFLRIIGGSA